MQTVGLHLEDNTLQLIRILKNKNSLQWELLPIISFNNENHVKHFYKLLPLLQDAHTHLVSGLSPEETVCRQIKLNIKSRRSLLAALPFQVDSLLPYPEGETLLYPIISPYKEGNTSLTLYASSTKHLENHINTLKNRGLDPDTVSTFPNALKRFSQHFFPDLKTALVFHVGLGTTTFVTIQEGRVTHSQSLPFGKRDCDQALESGNIPLVSEKIVSELKRLSGFLKNKGLSTTSTPSLYTGAPAGSSLLEKTFGPSITSQSQDCVPLLPFALPFGLALDGLFNNCESVQMREALSPSQKVNKSRKRLQATYLALSLSLALLVGGMHQCTITIKERSLQKKVSSLLKRDLPLKEGLAALEMETAAASKSFPYQPTVPAVSDVLKWLSSHPNLSTQNQKKGIDIQHFNYHLDSRPTLGEKREKYVAAVELEFIAPSPSLAREFHQALLKGDALVNEKNEVVWKAHQNTYYTKFYLKEKKE